jgi:hypothetical protein
MQAKLTQMMDRSCSMIRRWRTWSASPVRRSGFGATNTGSVFIALKPLAQRPPIDQVMAGLRRALRWCRVRGCS